MLDYFKRHGVDHICGYPPDPGARGRWTVEELQQTHDLCERHGVALAMVALPFLSSSHIDHEARGAILLGDGPRRDRDIDDVIAMIAACARVGIPAFKFNMSLLGVLRTASTQGRGGTQYSTWRLNDAKAEPPLTRIGRVSEEIAWERITYFLDRVIPALMPCRVVFRHSFSGCGWSMACIHLATRRDRSRPRGFPEFARKGTRASGILTSQGSRAFTCPVRGLQPGLLRA